MNQRDKNLMIVLNKMLGRVHRLRDIPIEKMWGWLSNMPEGEKDQFEQEFQKLVNEGILFQRKTSDGKIVVGIVSKQEIRVIDILFT